MVGKIVKYKGKFYYVCTENKGMYLFVPIKYVGKFVNLKMNDFVFERMIWVSNDEDFKEVGFVNCNKKLALLKKYRNLIDYENNKNKMQRGSLIFKNMEFYYIFGEDGNKWISFKVLKKNNEENVKVKVSKKTFYAKFDDIRYIDKNDNSFEVVGLASEEEIQGIKLIKKKYKSKSEEKIKKTSIKNKVSYGTIICLKKNLDIKFFVYDVIPSGVLCVSIDSIKNGTYEAVRLLWNEIEETSVKFEMDSLSLNIIKEISTKYSKSYSCSILSKKHR